MRFFSRQAKIAVAVLVVLVGATLGDASAQTLKLKVGTEGTYSPMSFFDPSGKLTGFEVELVEALCKRAEIDCSFEIMAFDGMTEAVLQGKIDAMATGVRMTEKRKKILDFTDQYYKAQLAFVVCGDTTFPGTAPADLKGAILGTQSQSAGFDYLTKHYGEGSQVRAYKTMDDAYLDLSAGRLDAVLSSELIGYGFMQRPEGAKCKYLGERINDPTVATGIGMALRRGQDEIREKLNAAIKSIRADGTYDAINKRYYPFSIF